MNRLYAPWRTTYARSIAAQKKVKTSATECVFCQIIKQKKDSENFIIKRYKYNVVILNRYPYNAGHLLIVPLAHKKELYDLDKNAREELMEIISLSTNIVKKQLKAHAINVGLNLGKAAGAGIPSHLHFHILPRWRGDTNFLPLLANTKQVSFSLPEMYSQIVAHWNTK